MKATDGGWQRLVEEVLCVGDGDGRRGAGRGGKRKWHVAACGMGMVVVRLGGGEWPAGDGQTWREDIDVTTHEDVTKLQTPTSLSTLPRGWNPPAQFNFHVA